MKKELATLFEDLYFWEYFRLEKLKNLITKPVELKLARNEHPFKHSKAEHAKREKSGRRLGKV